ncbi:sulfite exporter TauE/SafE family protein [Sporomusa termitida]|uniref:TIGR00003: copper ion binding protein n=1 Tax=Sporomusa termitida TaxID=2377 RepID=A0A517DVX9_9FIRM|nr:sulfite exporter TauE/SafE family protein [Sporomusa termitida]QDR81426.1 TIGR00003: copper ion binding protein [Sporomusa termitida]
MLITATFSVGDMHCPACEKKIEQALKRLQGITVVKASYSQNTVTIEFDPAICSETQIHNTIHECGYTVNGQTNAKNKLKNYVGIACVFGAIFILSQFTGNFDMSSQLTGQVTYLVIFVIGLMTSLHCVGMCGGLMMSQAVSAAPHSRHSPCLRSFRYNAGRIISYTLIGGIVGALGSVLAVSIGFMAGAAIIAGLFMIVMGLNLTGVTLFRRFLTLPRLFNLPVKPANSPFIVGLVNGLMPCGPLQTMQLYALSTGSILQGATAMLVFSLGTLPLMLSFGTITTMLSKDSTKAILRFSGVLVIVLGLIMTNRGLAIAGINPSFLNNYAVKNTGNKAMPVKAELRNGQQTIKIAATNQGYVPNVVYVQKNLPLKMIVTGDQINSCNNELIIPSLHIKKKLTAGDNIIEMTPQGEDLNFSCWMGMLRGLIKVVDDLNSIDISQQNVVVPPGKSCCSTNGKSQCCGNRERRPSIYGDDIRQIPTDRLLKKAVAGDNRQTVHIAGIGYELEPLIIVISKEIPAQVLINFAQFDTPQGKWEIVAFDRKKVIQTFSGTKGVYELELPPQPPGTLGIYHQGNIVGVVEVVENAADADPAKILAKLLQ